MFWPPNFFSTLQQSWLASSVAAGGVFLRLQKKTADGGAKPYLALIPSKER